jgi:chromosome segregation ATPase
MKTPAVVQMQPLEARALLSTSLPGPAHGPLNDNPVIQADLDQLHEDQAQFRKDKRASLRTIEADKHAVNQELRKLKDSNDNLEDELAPVKSDLRDDIRARNREFRQDLQAIQEGTVDERKAIRLDLKDLRAAKRAGDDAAISAAKADLEADRKALNDALAPLEAELKADQAKWKSAIADDHQAIQDKLEELDPALTPLFDKLQSDQDASKTKLDADRAAVQADQDKLEADLKALRDGSSGST